MVSGEEPLLGAARRGDIALVAVGAPADGAHETDQTPLVAARNGASLESEDRSKVVYRARISVAASEGAPAPGERDGRLARSSCEAPRARSIG